jgi:hypothetical protein
METNPLSPQRRPLAPPDFETVASSELHALFGKLIQEINKRILAGLDPSAVLDFIFDALGLLIPYERIGIALLDRNEQTVELHWVRSRVPIQNLKHNYTAPLAGSSLKEILQTGKPRVINDLLKYLEQHPHSENTKLIVRDGIRSNLTCPLKAQGKYVGFVFFSSTRPNVYTHDHMELFSSIADELSIIVEQSRLHDFFLSASSRDQSTRMMIHDLRSPLTVIQGYLEMLEDLPWYQKLSAEGKEVFSVLHRNSSYMLGLLNELSDLLQIERSPAFFAFQNVMLNDFCAEMEFYGKLLAEKKEIQFVSEISSNLPEKAEFDSQQIRRVLDNLFTNAIKFSRRNTRITFQVKMESNRLVFSVTDQGPGIPEIEIPKLFKEFGRTNIRPTEGERTTGLGLAIARKIVEKHRGEISVRSQVGKGSTFAFWIPV